MQWLKNEAGSISSYAPLLSMIAIILLFAVTCPWSKNGAGDGAQETADQFLRAVSVGDVNEAKSLSTGRVAFNLAQAGDLPQAEVVSVDTETLAASDKWAKVRVTVELTLADGSPDVGFYELELINTDGDKGGWKVISIRDTVPSVTGRGESVSDKDLTEVQAVFEQYLRLVAAGKYDQAAWECLAGPARRGQEAGASVVGKAAVVGDAQELTATGLYGRRDKLAVVEFSYRVDERKVRLVATLWQTVQGWRIVGLAG